MPSRGRHYHWAYTDLLHWDGHCTTVAGLACDGMKNSFTIIDTEEIRDREPERRASLEGS